MRTPNLRGVDVKTERICIAIVVAFGHRGRYLGSNLVRFYFLERKEKEMHSELDATRLKEGHSPVLKLAMAKRRPEIESWS